MNKIFFEGIGGKKGPQTQFFDFGLQRPHHSLVLSGEGRWRENMGSILNSGAIGSSHTTSTTLPGCTLKSWQP